MGLPTLQVGKARFQEASGRHTSSSSTISGACSPGLPSLTDLPTARYQFENHGRKETRSFPRYRYRDQGPRRVLM